MFKILIVEDNIINQKILKIMLSKLGFISDVVDNGKEALINMETQLYDLILMDCEMPIMNGYDTTQYIRNKLNNNVIIIAITANNTISAKQRCKKVGMNDYFTKPLTINNLSKIINKWLNIRK
jgi:CheY-like chemotaxis protein